MSRKKDGRPRSPEAQKYQRKHTTSRYTATGQVRPFAQPHSEDTCWCHEGQPGYGPSGEKLI